MRWEYFVYAMNVQGVFSSGKVNPRELQDTLNFYGNQGWELVTAFDTNTGRGGSRLVVLTFKRPLPALEPVMSLPVSDEQ
jgi:hypothetical protein